MLHHEDSSREPRIALFVVHIVIKFSHPGNRWRPSLGSRVSVLKALTSSLPQTGFIRHEEESSRQWGKVREWEGGMGEGVNKRREEVQGRARTCGGGCGGGGGVAYMVSNI